MSCTIFVKRYCANDRAIICRIKLRRESKNVSFRESKKN